MTNIQEDFYAPVYGSGYSTPQGFIAFPGVSAYRHRFGGETWNVVNRGAYHKVRPTLLLTLDLSDPAFSEFPRGVLSELPLCCILTLDSGLSPQFFTIDEKSRTVVCTSHGEPASTLNPNPWVDHLCEMPLTILPMVRDDYPVNEESYWKASDLFVGGSRFIRVLGPALWLYTVQEINCHCGNRMQYVCSLGYESEAPYSGLISNRPVFFGEFGIYWHFCHRCLCVCAVLQST